MNTVSRMNTVLQYFNFIISSPPGSGAYLHFSGTMDRESFGAGSRILKGRGNSGGRWPRRDARIFRFFGVFDFALEDFLIHVQRSVLFSAGDVPPLHCLEAAICFM